MCSWWRQLWPLLIQTVRLCWCWAWKHWPVSGHYLLWPTCSMSFSWTAFCGPEPPISYGFIFQYWKQGHVILAKFLMFLLGLRGNLGNIAVCQELGISRTLGWLMRRTKKSLESGRGDYFPKAVEESLPAERTCKLLKSVWWSLAFSSPSEVSGHLI